jgi:hypothetical protein
MIIPKDVQLKIAKYRIQFGVFVFSTTLLVLAMYFFVAEPAILGKLELRISADSLFYIQQAREPTGNLFSFSENYLGPFLLIRIFQFQNLALLLFNITAFSVMVDAITTTYHLRTRAKWIFISMLYFSPLTFISFLLINKEILGVIGIGWFLVFLRSKKISALSFALIFSLATRWQQVFVILLFLSLEFTLLYSRFRYKKLATLVALVILMSLFYPLIPQSQLEPFLEQSINASTINQLNRLQDNYLFFLVLPVKVFMNLFGNPIETPLFLINFSIHHDLYRVTVLLQEILMLFLFLFLLIRRKMKISNSITFFFAIYVIVYSYSPFVQSRYLFPTSILLILLKTLSKSKRSNVEYDKVLDYDKKSRLK